MTHEESTGGPVQVHCPHTDCKTTFPLPFDWDGSRLPCPSCGRAADVRHYNPNEPKKL
jgi:hypothetical protein